MRKKPSTVKFPINWEHPKYRFGQLTEQGLILSMEYYPADTILGRQFGTGWAYWVLSNVDDTDLEKYLEAELVPLDSAQINSLIQNHEVEIATLREQLNNAL